MSFRITIFFMFDTFLTPTKIRICTNVRMKTKIQFHREVACY